MQNQNSFQYLNNFCLRRIHEEWEKVKPTIMQEAVRAISDIHSIFQLQLPHLQKKLTWKDQTINPLQMVLKKRTEFLPNKALLISHQINRYQLWSFKQNFQQIFYVFHNDCNEKIYDLLNYHYQHHLGTRIWIDIIYRVSFSDFTIQHSFMKHHKWNGILVFIVFILLYPVLK